MIFSKKFVSDYVDIQDKSIKELASDMTKVGNEYDEADLLIKASNLVIGEVIECKMHPESDHLHVTKINVGNEILDIVCGAPNMRKGIKVIVALPGATLPGGTIKESVIRGAKSNGMCCSMAELGLDKKFLTEKDIEGIHELPLDAPIGEDAIKYLGLDDEIINFELTSNRSDLLSMLGLAYEVGAIYNLNVTEPTSEYKKVKDNFAESMTLNVETENCSLFLLGRANNVTITESPEFIKTRLIACGIRPINNVVDISNYIMLETGQPLHYYDADKVGNYLGVRMANDKELLTTLDNQERTLNKGDIVICNKNEAIGLAGVMGGLDTEVTENTKNILIESAQFNGTLIRKTSKRILRSEASNRFEKGVDISRTYLAMERSKTLLEKYATASISEDTLEHKNYTLEEKVIDITLEKINSVLGMNLTTSVVEDVFNRLGFTCTLNGTLFKVTVPSRRLDISIKEDLIEEVGRIYGVDNVEAKLPVVPSTPGHIDKYLRDIKIRLSNLGLNEVISYSLVSEKSLSLFPSSKEAISVLEPMVEEKKYIRKSLIPSLMEIYEYNKARNNKNVSVFEIGEVFYKEDNEYVQNDHLAILMTGTYISGVNNNINTDFYYIKGLVENLLDYLGYNKRYDFDIENTLENMHPYQTSKIIVNGKTIGFLGRIHPSIYKDDVYVCEINLTELRTFGVGNMKYKEISKFPSIKKDVSFIFDKEVLSKNIIKDIKNCSSKILNNVTVYDEYIANGTRSLTFTLCFQDDTETLREEIVKKEFDKIIDTITNKYNAKLKNM